MAKLTRVLQKIFGSTGATSEFGEIGSQAAGSATTTKDLATIQSLSQFLEGLYAITNSAGEPPRIQDLNSLYLLITSQLKYLFQEGVPEYSSTEDYYIGSVCQVNGVLYTSKTNSNTGNAVSNTTYWKKTLDVGELSGLGSGWSTALPVALKLNMANALANNLGFGALAAQGFVPLTGVSVVATLLRVGDCAYFGPSCTNLPTLSAGFWSISLVTGGDELINEPHYEAYLAGSSTKYIGWKSATDVITWTRVQTQDMYGANWVPALAEALSQAHVPSSSAALAIAASWNSALAAALSSFVAPNSSKLAGVTPGANGLNLLAISSLSAGNYVIPGLGSSPRYVDKTGLPIFDGIAVQNSYIAAKTFKSFVSGTITAKAKLYLLTVPGTAYLEVIKNGIIVGTEFSTTADLSLISVNMDIVVGDVISFNIKASTKAAVGYCALCCNELGDQWSDM